MTGRHTANRLLRTEHRSDDVYREDSRQRLGSLFVHTTDVTKDSRVGHKSDDGTERLLRSDEQTRDLWGIANIGLERLGNATSLPDCVYGPGRSIGTVYIFHGNRISLDGQPQTDGLANSARTSCDNYRAYVLFHWSLSLIAAHPETMLI